MEIRIKFSLLFSLCFLLFLAEPGVAQEEKPSTKKNGKVKEYYTSGKVEAKGKNKNYKKTGEWKFYRENGDLEKVENYKDGLKHGLVIGYEKGKISYTGEFKEDSVTGEWKYYDNEARLMQTKSITGDSGILRKYSPKTGKLIAEYRIMIFNNNHYYDGPFKEWYDNGNPRVSGYYKEEERDSVWKYWNSNNILFNETSYLDGVLHYKEIIYLKNGKKNMERYWKHGKLDGIYTEWYESGAVRETGEYEAGQPIGITTYYNLYGIKSREKIHLGIDDTVITKKYNEQGILTNSEKYINGKKVFETRYYSDGSKFIEYTVSNYKWEGKSTEYYSGGKIRKEGFYKDGQLEGIWRSYDQDGKLTSEELFENGVLKEAKFHYKTGTKKFVYIYEKGRLVKTDEYAANGKLITTTQPINLSTDYNIDFDYPVARPIEDGLEYPPVLDESKYNDDKVFVFVDQTPLFPDYDDYIRKNIKYPAAIAADSINAIVYVELIVRKDGSVDQARILRGYRPAFNEEALRVIKQMPNWLPGKNNGKPVDVKVTVAVNFTKP